MNRSVLHSNCLARLLVVEVPRVRDHQLEVLLVVDTCGHVAVVIEELVKCNLSIALLRELVICHIHSSMRFKCFEELLKHFLFGFLASAHIWVLLSIIALSNIVDVDVAIFIEVKFLEDTFDQVLPEGAHVTLNCMKKLIKRDTVVTVIIEELENSTAFFLAELDAEVAEALPEFLNF